MGQAEDGLRGPLAGGAAQDPALMWSMRETSVQREGGVAAQSGRHRVAGAH